MKLSHVVRVVLLVFSVWCSEAALSSEASDILAKAFAERSKIWSFECELVSKNQWGAVAKESIVVDRNKSSHTIKHISEGVLPEGVSHGANITVFDGETVGSYFDKAGSIRTHRTSKTRELPTPWREAFQWALSLSGTSQLERLDDWTLWNSLATKVVEVTQSSDGMKVLKFEGINPRSSDAYSLVSFDLNHGYFPVRHQFYRDDELVVESSCEVDWIVDGKGERVVFPIKTDSRNGVGVNSSWTSLEVDRATLKVNTEIKAAVFSVESLPKSKVLDVDKLNSSIKSQMASQELKKSPIFSRSIISIVLILITLIGVLFLRRTWAK